MSNVKVLKGDANIEGRKQVDNLINHFHIDKKAYYYGAWENAYTRLNMCKAWIERRFDSDNNIVYCLYSYQTLVAIYSPHRNVCYDILRYMYGYTTTSSQHILKFVHIYCNDNTVVVRIS